MKEALVTSAAGFLGQHLVKVLLDEGYKVTCLLREGKDASTLSGLDVTIRRINLKDKETLKGVVPKNCVVYHCYSLSPAAHASEEVYEQENVLSTQNFLEVCKDVSKFVYVSSSSVIGPHSLGVMKEDTIPHPDNHYGKTKLKAEELVKAFHEETGIPSMILRLSTLFGPGVHPNNPGVRLFRLVKKPIFVMIGNGKQTFEFSYIKNVAWGIYQASRDVNEGCETFNITDVDKVTFSTLVKAMAKEVNPNVKIIHIPKSLALGIGKVGDSIMKVTGKRFPFRTRTVKGVLGGWVTDPSKAVMHFGLEQKYSLEEAVKETVTWLKEKKRL